MNPIDRRTALQAGAALAASTLAACAASPTPRPDPAVANDANVLFRRAATVRADRRLAGGVPGAPHLLHRPQLRGACARDGIGSDPRAAVLLPEAVGRGAARADRQDHRAPVPDADEELPLRARARRGARYRRPRHPDRARARLRLRLRGRPRHDASRPAERDEEGREAVGDRQELRPFGADRPDPSGRPGRALHEGRDRAEGQRRREAERRPVADDLERRRADRQPVARVRAAARRHRLLGHAGERRPGRARAT